MTVGKLRPRLPLGVHRAVFVSLGCIHPKLDSAPWLLRGKTTFGAFSRSPVGAYFEKLYNDRQLGLREQSATVWVLLTFQATTQKQVFYWLVM